VGSRLLRHVLVSICIVGVLVSGCSLRADRSDGSDILFVREKGSAIYLMSPNAHVGVDLDVRGFFDLLVERIASLG